jgi:hypothetical protein
MNVNEYGVVLQFCVSFNMSAYTNLSITFTKPDLTTLTVPATLGAITVSTPLGTFAAQTYATYVFVQGNVDQAGEWSARLTYQDAGPTQLISTPRTFTVGT